MRRSTDVAQGRIVRGGGVVVALRGWLRFACVAVSLGACAAPAEDDVAPAAWRPISGPGQLLGLPGISLLSPLGERWYLQNGTSDRLILKKDVAGRAAHTVIALAMIETVELEGTSARDLLRLVERHQAEDAGSPRIVVRRVENIVDRGFPATCVRSSFEVLDRGAPATHGRSLVLAGGDLYCLHPSSRRTRLVHLGYSQRYPEGGTPLDLDQEFLSFTQSLVFLPVD